MRKSDKKAVTRAGRFLWGLLIGFLALTGGFCLWLLGDFYWMMW